jgi:hypothetical protein
MIVTRTSRSVNRKSERDAASTPNIEQQIRARAYQLYEDELMAMLNKIGWRRSSK